MDESTVWRGKAEAVYEQLRADIETGALEPGRPLPEVELVAQTGISRTPVREALRRLAAEGLVDIEPRRAPTVSRISLRSGRALFEFRRILEPTAIRMVAELIQTSPTVKRAMTDLAAQFRAFEGLDHSDELAATFTRSTAAFDDLLAAEVPNAYLGRAIKELRPHSARLRHIAHMDRSRLQEANAEHIAMCAAILAGDGDLAAATMTSHLRHVEAAIFARLLASRSDLLVS